eukprot:650171-Prymnesium_polylepis.2
MENRTFPANTNQIASGPRGTVLLCAGRSVSYSCGAVCSRWRAAPTFFIRVSSGFDTHLKQPTAFIATLGFWLPGERCVPVAAAGAARKRTKNAGTLLSGGGDAALAYARRAGGLLSMRSSSTGF